MPVIVGGQSRYTETGAVRRSSAPDPDERQAMVVGRADHRHATPVEQRRPGGHRSQPQRPVCHTTVWAVAEDEAIDARMSDKPHRGPEYAAG
jgi:hypothetical protein